MTTTPEEPEIVPGTSRPVPVNPESDPFADPTTEPAEPMVDPLTDPV